MNNTATRPEQHTYFDITRVGRSRSVKEVNDALVAGAVLLAVSPLSVKDEANDEGDAIFIMGWRGPVEAIPAHLNWLFEL